MNLSFDITDEEATSLKEHLYLFTAFEKLVPKRLSSVMIKLVVAVKEL